MAPLEGAVLPKGSLILVTGVNGYVGSHVADQFLRFGYKVRGTVRDTEKSAWIDTYFDQKYGAGNFELVGVEDLSNPDALKEVLGGKHGSTLEKRVMRTLPSSSLKPMVYECCFADARHL